MCVWGGGGGGEAAPVKEMVFICVESCGCEGSIDLVLVAALVVVGMSLVGPLEVTGEVCLVENVVEIPVVETR